MFKPTMWQRMIFEAFVIAAVLRFAALGQKALWSDELASLERTALPYAEHVAAMRGNHPLYEVLLRFWAPTCGGLTPLEARRADAMLRVPSAVFGAVTLVLVWLLAREFMTAAGAAATVWLLALSPLHVMFSRMGRPYALSLMLVALSNLMMWRYRQRGTFSAWAIYVVSTVLCLFANLVAGSVWLAQNLFMAIALRRERPHRRSRLRRGWMAAQFLILLMVLPWMIYSLPGAAQFGTDTVYRARQFGVFAKLLYLPFVFSVGETMHPLSPILAPFAFLGFGGLFFCGVWKLWRRGDEATLFLAVQFGVVFLVGVLFVAAAPKHLIVILPVFYMIVASGVEGLTRRPRWPGHRRVLLPAVRNLLMALALAAMIGSLVNYFLDREFHDADMVTPWQKMAALVRAGEKRGDIVIVGYHADGGIYRMFRRYYRGRRPVVHLAFSDWRGHLADALKQHRSVWLLLHDTDPREAIVQWARQHAVIYSTVGFQMEEHTLQGLQAGWGHLREYRSFLYTLYHVRRRRADLGHRLDFTDTTADNREGEFGSPRFPAPETTSLLGLAAP